MKKVLTTDHPEWQRFVSLLEELTDDGTVCHHDLRMTRSALAGMKTVDIDGSLESLQQHGGHCDCEVLMNVEGCRFELAVLAGKEEAPEWWDEEELQRVKFRWGWKEN